MCANEDHFFLYRLTQIIQQILEFKNSYVSLQAKFLSYISLTFDSSSACLSADGRAKCTVLMSLLLCRYVAGQLA